jgi:hypothetical protein
LGDFQKRAAQIVTGSGIIPVNAGQFLYRHQTLSNLARVPCGENDRL